jgi:hypothetical protein
MMSGNEAKPWRWHVTNAEHYKALEVDRVSLYDLSASELPWEFVTKIEGGGMHRLGAQTSAGFEATHPCGLRFLWSLDYEERGASGQGEFVVNRYALALALARLPSGPRRTLAENLRAFAEKVREHAAEYGTAANRQNMAANAIEAFIAEHVEVTS